MPQSMEPAYCFLHVNNSIDFRLEDEVFMKLDIHIHDLIDL